MRIYIYRQSNMQRHIYICIQYVCFNMLTWHVMQLKKPGNINTKPNQTTTVKYLKIKLLMTTHTQTHYIQMTLYSVIYETI